jgi:hypothetical protein
MDNNRQFFYGSVPMTVCEAHPNLQRGGKYRAAVCIGSSWYSRNGKTPERAAKALRVKLAWLFTYADELRERGASYAEASKRARLEARREYGAKSIYDLMAEASTS